MPQLNQRAALSWTSLLNIVAAPALACPCDDSQHQKQILSSSLDGTSLANIATLTTDGIPQLRDASCRSLGIIFDLYPESLADSLLTDINPALASNGASADASDDAFYAEVGHRTALGKGSTSKHQRGPADLLSMALTLTYDAGATTVLSRPQSGASSTTSAGDSDLSLRIRLLKILAGLCSLAGALSMQDRIKRLLLSPP